MFQFIIFRVVLLSNSLKYTIFKVTYCYAVFTNNCYLDFVLIGLFYIVLDFKPLQFKKKLC